MLVQALTCEKLNAEKSQFSSLVKFRKFVDYQWGHAHDQHWPTVFTIFDIHYFDTYQILRLVNCFDDFIKNRHFFIKSTTDVT